MRLPAEPRFCTIAEYLHHEREALNKHEFRDGQVIAMAGTTVNHCLIAANIMRELGNALKGKTCRVLDSNLRVRVPRTTLYTYPDASVICGPIELDTNDPHRETVTNPRVLIEILSPSTEGYDRGEKFTRYRLLDSLQEYVLISQDTARIETFLRQADGTWLFAAAAGLDARARLASLQIELALAEIYAGVDFPPVETPPTEPT